jgi:hypothetical protein
LRLGVRYLTGGSDVGYILSAGRADVKQLRERGNIWPRQIYLYPEI